MIFINKKEIIKENQKQLKNGQNILMNMNKKLIIN